MAKHTKKQLRQVMHIAATQRARGVEAGRALRIGWATVNKQKHTKKGKKRMAMPAALARWHRQHGHHKHKSHGRKSTALARRGPTSISVRVGGAVAKKKHHGRRGRGASGGHISREKKAWMAAFGALIGYTQDVKKVDLWDKIPTPMGLPKEAVLAIGLEVTGLTRKHKKVDEFAAASGVIGGYHFGASGFKLSGDDD